MKELALCPFCGCNMSLHLYTYQGGEQEWVLDGCHSDNCLFEVTFHTPCSTNKRKLIRAWNMRSFGAEIDALIVRRSFTGGEK